MESSCAVEELEVEGCRYLAVYLAAWACLHCHDDEKKGKFLWVVTSVLNLNP